MHKSLSLPAEVIREVKQETRGPLAQGLCLCGCLSLPQRQLTETESTVLIQAMLWREADLGRILFLLSPPFTYCMQILCPAHRNASALEELPKQHGRQAGKEVITGQGAKGLQECLTQPGGVEENQGRLPKSGDHFFHPWSLLSEAPMRKHLKVTDAITAKQQNVLNSHVPAATMLS